MMLYPIQSLIIGMALLLSSCANESETKALLGIAAPNTGQTPRTEPNGMTLPVSNMISRQQTIQ
jgi:PBP1b-binding outer membrane lipoprotein LpoB